MSGSLVASRGTGARFRVDATEPVGMLVAKTGELGGA